MNKLLSLIAVGAVAMGLNAAPINVTVQDPYGQPGIGIGGEVGEVEIGSIDFDLHAFFFDKADNNISLIGDYNLKTKVSGYELGDLFIDTNKDGIYDLAYTFDFDNLSYDIFNISNHTLIPSTGVNNGVYTDPGLVEAIHYDIWKYNPSAGDYLTTGNFIYDATNPNSISGIHVAYNSFNASITMECGNDVTKASVPEPFTSSLLGIGLLSVAFFSRRKRS